VVSLGLLSAPKFEAKSSLLALFLALRSGMFESTANRAEYAALDDKRRTFHVLTRTVGIPIVGDYIQIREVDDAGPAAVLAGIGTPTGRQLYVRIRYVEAFTPVPHTWIVSIELSIGSTRRLPAVRITGRGGDE
jgi:hypothetical protein